MLVRDIEEIGKLLRDKRKRMALTQSELAAVCGTGVRFISELENGKPTLEIGKVLHVIEMLGIDITLEDR